MDAVGEWQRVHARASHAMTSAETMADAPPNEPIGQQTRHDMHRRVDESGAKADVDGWDTDRALTLAGVPEVTPQTGSQ
jgi:hypothetical protein